MDRERSFRSLSSAYFTASQLIDEIKTGKLSNVVDFLERKRVDWNLVLPEHGGAALHFLAGLEDEVFAVGVLQRALRGGGDPNTRTEEGLTAVHLAAMWGRCGVLRELLSHGGDPGLVDWRQGLDAEEHALKERQYEAYGVLTTYSVIAEDPGRFGRYLSDESPDSTPRTDDNNTTTTDNNGVCADHDWLEHLPVSGKAADMIKEHRKSTTLYEDPKATTYRDCWEHVLSELPKRGAKESVYEIHDDLNSDISGRLKDTRDENIGRLEPIYEEIKDDYDLDDCEISDRKKVRKHRRSSKCREKSELYLEGFEEVSTTYSTVDRRRRHDQHDQQDQDSRTGASSDLDVHSRVLYKMSRIYLFMLKKRHIFQRPKHS